jgi:outer membrane receptor protein involved in Fe transport
VQQTIRDALKLKAPRPRDFAALVIALSFATASSYAGTGEAGPADQAQAGNSATTTTTTTKKSDELQEVVVTGSLIPQARVETSSPVVTITAEDLQTKGFTTVADALQHSSFATGSVQNGGFSGGFTQGANTISLFGLDPSYTKFLIDGKPIADYPALYNGSVNFVSISGIPTLLIDGIDELPGAQSSIYGSDAIAGVINIRLKKKMDGPEIDARYGWTTDGGGVDKRFALADGFSFGGVNILVGGQYEKTSPIWGYKRPDTSQYFNGNPGSPQTAERDYLVLGYFGQANGDLYYFPPGADCGSAASTFNGTLAQHSRAARGLYCGTDTAGYYTIANGTEATQGYLHASDDLNDHAQLYVDVLIDHDVARFSTGAGFFDTADDSAGPYGYYYDPNLGDLMNLQHIFSPEEAGGLNNTMDKNTTNSLRMTAGIQGDFEGTNWKYDAAFTYTENKLTELTHLQFEDEINDYYSSIMGSPEPGAVDPFFGAYPVYTPNYAAFYKPLTTAQYDSFTGYATSRSRTEDSMLRVQLTDAKMFSLPGGDAGLAIVGEAGAQGWAYDPDPRYLDGETYLYTATSGSGHRARYAVTTELKMPIVKMLTVDLSGRYDEYRAAGNSIDAGTYNLGVEFRPINTLLFRGRYGTAFKAPTLADQFQGQSGFYQAVNDYYGCEHHGYAGDASCPYFDNTVFGTTQGNTQLQPIHAKVWDLGIAYSPVLHSNFTADFIRWKIDDEVEEQNSQQLVDIDGECLDGKLDVTSPTCQNAISQVTRDANGLIVQISTPKINVSSENLSVAVFGANYEFPTTYAGTFIIDAKYTNILRHRLLQFPGDSEINLLENPFFSTEFKSKENVAFTWNYKSVGTTLYVERYGRTPNEVSTLTTDGYNTPGGGRLGTWTLANLEVQYEVLPGLVLAGNVNNLFNKMPPTDNTYLGIDNQPYNSLNYNNYGRAFFVQATYKYGK